MSTYYDELGLSPQAGAADLQAALDTCYNEYRAFINHPDPDKRAEAEANQRRVERMREELLDAAKRAAYDASIGVGEAGGLADPAAAPRPTPPRPKRESGAAGVTDLWACPSCNTPNSEWTAYCLNCRTPLLRKCPECGQMKSLVKTGVCGNCGYEYATAEKRAALRKEIQALKEQVKIRQDMLSAAATQLKAVEQSQKGAGSDLRWAIILFGLPSGLCLLISCAALLLGAGAATLVLFIPALTFLAIAGILLSNINKKKETAQQETAQLQQQIVTLNAEVASLQNELQAKQAEFERLSQ